MTVLVLIGCFSIPFTSPIAQHCTIAQHCIMHRCTVALYCINGTSLDNGIVLCYDGGGVVIGAVVKAQAP